MNTVLRLKRKRGLVFDAYYFKARENDWYFSGIEGERDLELSLATVRAIRDRYDRVLYLGNSMGGYGALLFGLDSNATEILVFSPQTRFDLEFCTAIGERRWRSEFSSMRTVRDAHSMAVRARWPESCSTRVQGFAGELNPQDMAHCRELQGLQGFELKLYPQSGHDLVHDLRATGELEQIIVDTIVRMGGKDVGVISQTAQR